MLDCICVNRSLALEKESRLYVICLLLTPWEFSGYAILVTFALQLMLLRLNVGRIRMIRHCVVRINIQPLGVCSSLNILW